jgi:hypothetical protein
LIDAWCVGGASRERELNDVWSAEITVTEKSGEKVDTLTTPSEEERKREEDLKKQEDEEAKGGKEIEGLEVVGVKLANAADDRNVVLTLSLKEVQQESPNCFTPRSGQAAVLVGDKIYVFGGQNFHDAKHSEELMTYDISKNRWQIVPAKAGPSARNSASLVYSQALNALIVFGGADNDGPKNDMWSFSLTDGTWKKIEQSGKIPSCREMHSAHISTTQDAAGKITQELLFLVGGRTLEGVSDDLFCCQCTNAEFKWSRLMTLPKKICAHGSIYLNDLKLIILYAGTDGAQFFDDFMIVNTTKVKAWTNASSTSPVIAPSMCFLPGSGSIIVFGGSTYDKDLGDFHTVQLSLLANPPAQLGKP